MPKEKLYAEDVNIYDTATFITLAEAMKDRDAYQIVAALLAVQVGTDNPVFTNAERYFEDQADA